MSKTLRRLTAGLIAGLLILEAPGLASYEAWGAMVHTPIKAGARVNPTVIVPLGGTTNTTARPLSSYSARTIPTLSVFATPRVITRPAVSVDAAVAATEVILQTPVSHSLGVEAIAATPQAPQPAKTESPV